MRLKYIIAAVLASVAILFGVYNWISYFKQQTTVSTPAIQALRPPPRKELSQIEQASAVRPGSETRARAAQEAENELSSGPVGQFPDTVGRNPFLWPEEILAIAEGETFDKLLLEPAEPSQISPPDLKLSGLIKDNVTGKYRAMIDGRIFDIGDTTGGEKIVEITGRSVVLEYGGNRRTLTLETGKEERAGLSTIKMKKNP